MTAFRINDEEQLLLRQSELSHAAKLLYVIGLRPRMDFRTGIVGKVRRVSYQTFHEDLEYLPSQGSTRTRAAFSVASLRALVAELERVGLIRRLANDHRALFFECLVADREDAPKNMNSRGTTLKSSRGTTDRNTSNDAGFSGYPQPMNNRAEEWKNDTPLVSGKPLYTSQAAALLSAPVDNFAALRFDEIADWIKTAEKRRGKIVAVAVADTNVKSWVSRGVDAVELQEAHALAVADREKQSNPAPIHAGFLNIFVSRVVGKRTPWFSTWSGIVAMGSEYGLTQFPDEQNQVFKHRVFAAAVLTDEEARQWQE